MTDVVQLIRLWADDPDAGVPPTIPTEYALLAVDEIEHLRSLITNWMDAQYDSNYEDPSHYHQDVADAWQALRRAVGRENILGPG